MRCATFNQSCQGRLREELGRYGSNFDASVLLVIIGVAERASRPHDRDSVQPSEKSLDNDRNPL